ncbi:TetR/AcrR family transcriptional regulator (plasmid) [Paraburkholderia sp. D15]|uniref:TetR/AcrR family transcriptional regulator n=1 Tax=Paraburkholderia sp. D15 TaxID=2880218 RepID=UPI00247ABC5A|nr:TetR/AcrR family transcriptional regulator [Paraburkholderia sp. D15]WGS55142.1 TetR/AcrR family transcriptional regulator [Paraburkholderia sp. D15]
MIDHRTKVAEKKRVLMRARLLDAAMRVFAEHSGPPPVIDDVIREAKVSRGTFYKYFDSLEQVLVAIGQELSNQMTTDIMPVYGVLSEPWQRAAVGFRLFLVRALLDRKWAGFVSRVDVWPHHTLVAQNMAADLERGKAAGQFSFDRVEVATDFLMGASAHGIQTIRQGVADPNAYMDASVRMALASLGCKKKICDEGVAFSYSYLKAWACGDLTANKPLWALNMNSKDGRLFLSHEPVANA